MFPGSKVSLTDNPSDATKFRRYNEHNTSKAVSYGGKTQYPWAGTFQTSEGMCLTEIYPGDYVESNGKKDRSIQSLRRSFHAEKWFHAEPIVTCVGDW